MNAPRCQHTAGVCDRLVCDKDASASARAELLAKLRNARREWRKCSESGDMDGCGWWSSVVNALSHKLEYTP